MSAELVQSLSGSKLIYLGSEDGSVEVLIYADAWCVKDWIALAVLVVWRTCFCYILLEDFADLNVVNVERTLETFWPSSRPHTHTLVLPNSSRKLST